MKRRNGIRDWIRRDAEMKLGGLILASWFLPVLLTQTEVTGWILGFAYTTFVIGIGYYMERALNDAYKDGRADERELWEGERMTELARRAGKL